MTFEYQVTGTLRLAQLATLNPSKPFQSYMPGSRINLSDDKQMQFSPNVIRLKIPGFNFPNLSFYNLSGVINVSEVTEKICLIDLIKNLAKDYIKADKTYHLVSLRGLLETLN